MFDGFCGRFGWAKAFLARGWEVTAVDLVRPTEVPDGIEFIQADMLTITAEYLRQFDFACFSSPCEQFSVHGMKHFHPNPPYPEMGIKLFNHTRSIAEASGIPYVMENVRAAQQFVGRAVHHLGSFYLWGNAVPPLMTTGISKTKWTSNRKLGRDKPGNQCPEFFIDKRLRAAILAVIPPELSSCVADYAERLIEQRMTA
jgi:hypothetical protein